MFLDLDKDKNVVVNKQKYEMPLAHKCNIR